MRIMVSISSEHEGKQEDLKACFLQQQVDAGWQLWSHQAHAEPIRCCWTLLLSWLCHLLSLPHVMDNLSLKPGFVSCTCLLLLSTMYPESLYQAANNFFSRHQPLGKLWNPVVSTKMNKQNSLHKLKDLHTFRTVEIIRSTSLVLKS